MPWMHPLPLRAKQQSIDRVEAVAVPLPRWVPGSVLG